MTTIEFKSVSGALAIKSLKSTISFYFADNEGTEFEINYDRKNIVNIHKIFEYDLNVFMEMIKDMPDISIWDNRATLIYSIPIGKSNTIVQIDIPEKVYSGASDIISLQKKNRFLSIKLKNLDNAQAELRTISLYNLLGIATSNGTEPKEDWEQEIMINNIMTLLRRGVYLDKAIISSLRQWIPMQCRLSIKGVICISNIKFFEYLQSLRESMAISNMNVISNNILEWIVPIALGEYTNSIQRVINDKGMSILERREQGLDGEVNFDSVTMMGFLIENGLSVNQSYRQNKGDLYDSYYDFCKAQKMDHMNYPGQAILLCRYMQSTRVESTPSAVKSS